MVSCCLFHWLTHPFIALTDKIMAVVEAGQDNEIVLIVVSYAIVFVNNVLCSNFKCGILTSA